MDTIAPLNGTVGELIAEHGGCARSEQGDGDSGLRRRAARCGMGCDACLGQGLPIVGGIA